MKKTLISLALLATAATAASTDSGLLEERAKQHNTPRKVERFMQGHYQNYQDNEPYTLNSTESFLESGYGDEKELVNAAVDMLRKNGYNAEKWYYITQSGIEHYAAYIQDPPQKNNYLMHLDWQTELTVTYYPTTVIDQYGHICIYQQPVYHQRRYIAPSLITGFGNETDAKMYLQQQESVQSWNIFEYDKDAKSGLVLIGGQ